MKCFITGIIIVLPFVPGRIAFSIPTNPDIDTNSTHQESVCCEENFPDLYLNNPYMQSPEVLEIQEALAMLGFYQGNMSGEYDEDTAFAVLSFQKKIGLATDGQVKYHVWLKLAKALEDNAAAKTTMSPPTGDVSVIIDTFRRKLIVLNDNTPYAQFPIAIGKAETPSPIGNWKVINKRMNWGSGFGTRWLGLNVPWGVYGIHGTNKPWSIGSMASHGCFRMWNKNVEIIYPWIKNNTPVTVIGNPFGYMSGGLQTLNAGDKGSAVLYVQEKLKRLGFYEGVPDGIYGQQTEKAVFRLQEYYKLEKTGQIGFKEYTALKLW